MRWLTTTAAEGIRRAAPYTAVLLIGVLATGWAMEYRQRQVEVRLTERWEQRVALHVLMIDEALALAAPNVVERGLAYAQAVRNVQSSARRPPGPHPSVTDRPAPPVKAKVEGR